MLTTHAEVINQDLLAFIRSQECEAASGTVNEAPGKGDANQGCELCRLRDNGRAQELTGGALRLTVEIEAVTRLQTEPPPNLMSYKQECRKLARPRRRICCKNSAL